MTAWSIDAEDYPFSDAESDYCLSAKVINGERPSLNPDCRMNDIIKKCWNDVSSFRLAYLFHSITFHLAQDQEKRPKFLDIVKELKQLISVMQCTPYDALRPNKTPKQPTASHPNIHKTSEHHNENIEKCASPQSIFKSRMPPHTPKPVLNALPNLGRAS